MLLYSCDPSPLRIIPLLEGVLSLVAIMIEGKVEAGGRGALVGEVGKLGRLLHSLRCDSGYSNIQRWSNGSHVVLRRVYSFVTLVKIGSLFMHVGYRCIQGTAAYNSQLEWAATTMRLMQ